MTLEEKKKDRLMINFQSTNDICFGYKREVFVYLLIYKIMAAHQSRHKSFVQHFSAIFPTSH